MGTLIGVIILFFSPVLLSGRVLAPGDAWLQTLPAYAAGWSLWTPYLMTGFPVAADPTTMNLYPPFVLFQWLSLSWNAFILLGYVLAAILMFIWVRHLTASTLSGWIAGCVFALSGYLVDHLQHPGIVHGAIWIPVMLLGVDILRRQQSYRGIVFLTIGMSMTMLAGHPQTALYAYALIAAYSIASLLTIPRPMRWKLLRLGLMAVFAAVLLTALFWLPLLELARESARARIDEGYFLGYSLHYRDFIQLFFPMIWGGESASFYQVPYFGGETNAGQGYVGPMALVLLLVAILAAWRHGLWRKQVAFWTAVSAVAFVLALGGSTPIGAWMYHVPLYNMFRVPSRNLMEWTVAASLLAGIGTAALRTLADQQQKRLAITAVGILTAATFLLLGVIWLVEDRIAVAAHKWAGIEGWQARFSNAAISIPLLMLLLTVAALFLRFRQSMRSIALPAVLVATLGSYSWFASWRYDTPTVERPPIPATLKNSNKDAMIRFLGSELLMPDSKHVVNNWPRVWGVSNIAAYNPLGLRRFRQLLGMSAFGRMDQSVFNPVHRGLDILAVRHIYADEARAAILKKFPHRYRLIEQLDGIWHFNNLSLLPRARLVGQAVLLPDDKAINAIRQGRLPDGKIFDPASMAIVRRPVPKIALQQKGSVQLLEERDVEVTLSVKTTGPSLLVLADSYYPGWQAEIDGRPAEIWRANAVSRAVPVPSGEHEVRFYYRPLSLYWGTGLSAVTLLSLVFFGAWHRKGISRV